MNCTVMHGSANIMRVLCFESVSVVPGTIVCCLSVWTDWTLACDGKCSESHLVALGDGSLEQVSLLVRARGLRMSGRQYQE